MSEIDRAILQAKEIKIMFNSTIPSRFKPSGVRGGGVYKNTAMASINRVIGFLETIKENQDGVI